MIAFKMLDSSHDVLCSLTRDNPYEGRMVYYENNITKRKRGWGPMACFNSLMDVYNFCKKRGWWNEKRYVIYVVKIKESKAKSLWYRSGYSNEITKTKDIPPGTIFADTIKLICKITEDMDPRIIWPKYNTKL